MIGEENHGSREEHNPHENSEGIYHLAAWFPIYTVAEKRWYNITIECPKWNVSSARFPIKTANKGHKLGVYTLYTATSDPRLQTHIFGSFSSLKEVGKGVDHSNSVRLSSKKSHDLPMYHHILVCFPICGFIPTCWWYITYTFFSHYKWVLI